jgi:type I restriction enzyme M protein
MDQATHNKIVSFIWGIADDVLRDLFRRGKYPDVIRVSEYLTELPLLRARLHQAIEHALEQAARQLPGSGEQP